MYISTTSGLFQNLDDKDLFIEVYRLGLARRLLNDKFALEFEKSLIGKIKLGCGPQYTSKLEGMVTDLGTSRIVEEEFLEERKGSLPIQFNLKVLTNGHWPTYPPLRVKLPV